MDALPVTLESPPAYYQNLDKHNDCYITRVAYDMGSTTTKVVVARVNVCTHTIENVLGTHTYPVGYLDDLVDSQQLQFSPWLQAYSLEMMHAAKMQAELDVVSMPTLVSPRTQHCAVATQAFRIAHNGDKLTSEISERLGIPVVLISQEEEGKLAYMSVLSQWQALNRTLPVVWELGGGSSQLTFRNEVGEFYVVGTDMASRPFQRAVSSRIMGKTENDSPNPMAYAQIQLAINLAKSANLPNNAALKMIRERIAHDASVVGVGKVHNLSALLWVQKSKKSSQQGYSKDDLVKAMDFLTHKTDAEIQALAPDIPASHIPSQVTNLILLYAMMDKLQLDWVDVLDVNNTWGLLLTGCS